MEENSICERKVGNAISTPIAIIGRRKETKWMKTVQVSPGSVIMSHHTRRALDKAGVFLKHFDFALDTENTFFFNCIFR